MQAVNDEKRQENDNLKYLREDCSSSLLKHESCCHCNGYYGPCFGEPLCATCHAFLCPPDPFKTDAPLQLCDQKADECDSGNEEPRETQQDGVLLPRTEDNRILFPYEDAEDFAVLSKQQYSLVFAADRSSEVAMYPPGDIVMMAAAAGSAAAAVAQFVSSYKECQASSSAVQDVFPDAAPLSDSDTNDVEVEETKQGAGLLASENKIHCKCSANNLKDLSKKHSACRNGVKKKLSVECNSVAGAAAAAVAGSNDIRPEAAGVSQELLQNLSLKDFDEMIIDLKDDANKNLQFFASQAVERLHNSLKEKSNVKYKAVQHNYFECSSEACTEDGKNGCFSSKGVCQCSSTPNGYQLQERICLLTNFQRYADTEPSELANMMPPEVWMLVFRRLDDVSLWQCSRVSASWRQMVLSNWGHDSWRRFTLNRWRFFRPLYTPVHWHALYTSLMDSSPCRLCHAQMLQPIDPSTLVEQKSWRMTRLRNENRNLMSDPPEGIEAAPLDPQCLRWQAAVRGPDQSPYQGGTFYLHILIPPRYPLGPPVVRFLTKIFHPNVSSHGDIGIDSIQHNWSLALTISKVLISIQSLLTDPYTKVCMQPLAGRLYDCDRVAFNTVAREWTWRYAMTDTLQPRPCADELTLCEAITTESFEENSLDDMSPILPTGEEENNDQEQDNDQEQENNEHEPEINDHEQENNDQEQENNEQ